MTIHDSNTLASVSRRLFLAAVASPLPGAPSWREFLGGDWGATRTGAAPPLEWSDQRNLAWSLEPQGYGQSSPVVFGDRLFITSVDGKNKERLILAAYRAAQGEALWSHSGAPATPEEVTDMVSRAAPTPAVDERAVYAFFETGNIGAFDHLGKPLWERRLTEEFGAFGGRHGIGSSLRLCKAGVLALAAHDGPSYLLCLDRATGETVWKADRDPEIGWSTPTVVRRAGVELALISGQKSVDAYDLADGSFAWTLDGIEGGMIASPTPTAEGAIIGSSNKGQTAAIRFADDSTTAPEIIWRAQEAASYFSSPLLHRGRVYMVNKAGVAFCLDANTGREVWHQRLQGPCWASAYAAGEAVFFFGVDGAVEVFEAGGEPVKLAENRLTEESRLYGYAVADGRLFLRYGRRLVCVASEA